MGFEFCLERIPSFQAKKIKLKKKKKLKSVRNSVNIFVFVVVAAVVF